MSIRVVVIGDDPLARAGLVALVSGRDDLLLVGQGSADDAARLTLAADVVLWDAGSSASTLDIEDQGAGRFLVLASDERQAAHALADGARGVLPRGVSAEQLAIAVSAVHAGLLVVDEAFGELLGTRGGPPPPLSEPLTARELQVMALLSEGLSNKTIASRLTISESTAKFHVAAILGKLGVGSRAEAIVQAARLGLVIF